MDGVNPVSRVYLLPDRSGTEPGLFILRLTLDVAKSLVALSGVA